MIRKTKIRKNKNFLRVTQGSCRVVHLSAPTVLLVGACIFLEQVMSDLWLVMRQQNLCQGSSDSWCFVMLQVILGEICKVCPRWERDSIHMHHFWFNQEAWLNCFISASTSSDITTWICISYWWYWCIFLYILALTDWLLIVNESHLVISDLLMLSKKED